MITDVGLDLDGVVFDFATVVQKHFSDYLKRDLPFPRTWEFYEEWDLTAGQFYDLLDLFTHEREMFDVEAPIPKTMVGWQALRDQGLNIHIITHRSPSAYGQTVKWLERYRLIPDSLHFSGDKARILSAITSGESASIDDHYEQYISYCRNGVNAFLFDQPWNRNHAGRRVHTLPEFAEYVRVYNQYNGLEAKYGTEVRESVFAGDFF